MPNDEDTLAHPEQPRFLLSAWLWAVALFVFFGAIVAITFGAMHRGSNYEEGRAKARVEKLKAAREEWQKNSGSYAWVDKAKGVARIPLARAMELELADLQAKQLAPAGPITTPAPEVPPATGAAAPQPTNPPVTIPPGSAAPAPIAAEGPKSEQHGQPAAAANPSDAVPATQPGASATPAAGPKTQSDVPPVSPTGTPILKAPGTPLPVRGAPTATPPP